MGKVYKGLKELTHSTKREQIEDLAMKDVKVSERSHARLAAYGRKDQTFSDVIDELLGETRLLPQFIQRLEHAIAKGEEARKDAAHSRLAYEALDEVVSAAKELIVEIRKR